MTVKLFWQDVGPHEGPFPAQLRRAISDVAKQAARPDTTIEVRGLERMAGPSSHAATRLLNAREMLRSMARADREGYDALILGCNLDPVLWEAKEALQTPVVGSGEASVLWGLSLGDRLGMVAADDKHVPLLEALIARYGLRERFVARQPVRSISLTREEFPRMFEVRRHLVQRFRVQAEALIDEGAEVIVSGCVLLGLLCAQEKVAEAAPGVPMVNPVHVSVKQAEALAELRRAGVMPDFSRRLRYRRPSQAELDSLYKALDL